MARKSQLGVDTIAHIAKANEHLSTALKVLSRTKQAGQEIADIAWARILLENAVRGLTKLRKGEVE